MRVWKMAKCRGVAQIEFANKKGVVLPSVDWIAGVDFKKKHDNDDNNSNQDNEDHEHVPRQKIRDTDLQHNDCADKNKADDLLWDDDQQDKEQEEEQELNPAKVEDEQQEEEEKQCAATDG